MKRGLTFVAAYLGLLVAAGALVYILWLARMNAHCVDSRGGACSRLDHPFWPQAYFIFALSLCSWLLYAVASPGRRAVLQFFAHGTVAVQILWLVAYVPLLSRYHHPHAGGRDIGCLDECIGSFFNYVGWWIVQVIIAPLVVGAAYFTLQTLRDVLHRRS